MDGTANIAKHNSTEQKSQLEPVGAFTRKLLYCLINLACVHVCVCTCETHPGRCCSSWRWSLVGVGPAGWNDNRTSAEWCSSPACWQSPFPPCSLKAGSKVRGGTRRGIKRRSDERRGADPTHLVVYLELLQCAVMLQWFNQGQDSPPRDEVRLHVEALQSRVHFHHLCQSLKKHRTLRNAHVFTASFGICCLCDTDTGKPRVGSDKWQNASGLGVMAEKSVTHECDRVVASGSDDAQPLHHCVLHQSLGVRLQDLDGDVLRAENPKPPLS